MQACAEDIVAPTEDTSAVGLLALVPRLPTVTAVGVA